MYAYMVKGLLRWKGGHESIFLCSEQKEEVVLRVLSWTRAGQGLARWRGELFVKAVSQRRSVCVCCCFVAKRDQLSPLLTD